MLFCKSRNKPIIHSDSTAYVSHNYTQVRIVRSLLGNSDRMTYTVSPNNKNKIRTTIQTKVTEEDGLDLQQAWVKNNPDEVVFSSMLSSRCFRKLTQEYLFLKPRKYQTPATNRTIQQSAARGHLL